MEGLELARDHAPECATSADTVQGRSATACTHSLMTCNLSCGGNKSNVHALSYQNALFVSCSATQCWACKRRDARHPTPRQQRSPPRAGASGLPGLCNQRCVAVASALKVCQLRCVPMSLPAFRPAGRTALGAVDGGRRRAGRGCSASAKAPSVRQTASERQLRRPAASRTASLDHCTVHAHLHALPPGTSH